MQTIISNHKKLNKPVYAVFVDFKKDSTQYVDKHCSIN